MVEKAFSNIKERLNGNRLLVSSEEAIEGKLFVHFIGLFLLSYIKKQIQEHAMFSKYSMSSLLDVIERIHIPDKPPIVREILNKQILVHCHPIGMNIFTSKVRKYWFLGNIFW